MAASIKLIECPRDAMQGWKAFIPTEKKIQYINSLLKVGFDTIDFGSFVSPSCGASRCVLAISRQPILQRAQAREGEGEKL